jgi:phage terminase large subunit-like protein
MSSLDLTVVNRMYDYVEDILDGKIVAGKYTKLACQRFVDDISSDQFEFDVESAARYITFIEKVCIHTRGEHGKPFILSPWQVFFVGQLFGWKRKGDLSKRRFTTAHLFVGRKNGKSQLAAAIILAMAVLDDDGAPQFVTAATKRDQAKEVFDEIRRIVKASAPLNKRFSVNRNEILSPREGIIKPLSSDANTLDGLSLNVGCVDEMHAMKNGDLYRVLSSSMGSRKNPLMLAISTAGFVLDGLATEFVKGGKAVLDGNVVNDSLLFMIYELDEDDQWSDSECWIKANPNLGVSISEEWLKDKYENAKIYSGRHITEFMVKHCNLFVGSDTVWVEEEVWMSEDNVEPLPTPNKQEAYIGLDLSETDDITAIAVAIGDVNSRISIYMQYFVCRSAVERRLKKDETSIYSRIGEYDNVYVMDTNSIDYNVIRRKISGYYVMDGVTHYDEDNISNKFNLKSVAYDRWNSLSLIRDLEGDGVVCSPYGQGYASLSFPSKTLEKLARDGKLQHGGDEVLRWMMSNVKLRMDPSGNIKPDKEKSGDKIDGVVAAVMSIGEMLSYTEEDDSAFEPFFTVV